MRGVGDNDTAVGWTPGELQVDSWQLPVIILFQSVETGSGAHPDSCVLGTVGEGAPFSGGKTVGA